MVTKGLSYDRGIFGYDSEKMVARLLGMVRHPANRRRPDLLSPYSSSDGTRLTMEVKSGVGGKGVLVDYQLHYAIRTGQDYLRVFGEFIPKKSGVAQGVLFRDKDFVAEEDSEVAYYYNVVERNDRVLASDLTKPFSSIKLKWGNQHIVPQHYAFLMFAIERARKTGTSLKETVKYLHELMKKDYSEGTSHYEGRKQDRNSWQNLCTGDIMAIFTNDLSETSKLGQERVRILRDNYDVKSLTPISIAGPNNTVIYILAEKHRVSLFTDCVAPIVEKRISVIEKITRARARASGLLRKIGDAKVAQRYLKGFENPNKKVPISLSQLTRNELARLERLVNWLDAGE